MTHPIPGPREQTPEWLDLHNSYDPERERPIVFGASEAADVCNQGYKTALDVYMERKGLKPRAEHPESLKRKLKRGRRWQKFVIEDYSEEYEVAVDEPERMFFHPLWSFMGASPDGLVVVSPPLDIDNTVYGWIVETKSSDPRMFSGEADDESKYGVEGTDMVPTSVLFQVQQQMAVMNLSRCDVPVLFGPFTVRVYTVERNEVIVEAITEAERELADRITSDDPPSPKWTHPNTKRLLSALYGYRAGEGVTLMLEHQKMALANAKAKAEIKRLSTEIDDRNNRMLAALEGAEFGDLPNGKRIKRIRVGEAEVPAYTRKAYEFVREVKGKP